MVDFTHVKAVCFDVDSTVCPDEGIDMLASFCNKEEIVQGITARAMEGKLDFSEALHQRLEILSLTKDVINEFLDKNPLRLTPGLETLFQSLRANDVDLYLVSGGIIELVDRVAKKLGVPDDHVFANHLVYNDAGLAIDFDRQQPTSRSRGKSEVVAMIKERLANSVDRESDTPSGVLMVGDGMTDAAACPPADAFLGFGGVVVRPAVKQSTPYFFHTFGEMHDFLRHCGLIKRDP